MPLVSITGKYRLAKVISMDSQEAEVRPVMAIDFSIIKEKVTKIFSTDMIGVATGDDVRFLGLVRNPATLEERRIAESI